MFFIVDSGASVHLANSLELFTELEKPNEEKFTIADGSKLTAQSKGKCTFKI